MAAAPRNKGRPSPLSARIRQAREPPLRPFSPRRTDSIHGPGEDHAHTHTHLHPYTHNHLHSAIRAHIASHTHTHAKEKPLTGAGYQHTQLHGRPSECSLTQTWGHRHVDRGSHSQISLAWLETHTHTHTLDLLLTPSHYQKLESDFLRGSHSLECPSPAQPTYRAPHPGGLVVPSHPVPSHRWGEGSVS